MKKRILRMIVLAAVLMGTAATGMAATKALFLTGGQSNTEGRLYAVTLPDYLQAANSYLAFNAAVPGTVYVLFSSKDASQERTLDLYYEGTKAASATSTGSSDIQEIKYNVTAAGTLVLDCRKTCRVYALRFVPDEAGVYNRVTAIGWGSMSLPYPALVPEGTCVYYVSGYEDGEETGTLTLTKVDAGGIIPAKAGFLPL